MEIYKFLESRMIREIDAMPYNLSQRKINKLVIKALKKVGYEAAKKLGVETPKLQGLIEMFQFTNSFPSFPNECYVQLLRGDKGIITKIGETDENGDVKLYN